VEHQGANAPLVALDQGRERFPFPALDTLDPIDLLGIPGRVLHPDSIGFALIRYGRSERGSSYTHIESAKEPAASSSEIASSVI